MTLFAFYSVLAFLCFCAGFVSAGVAGDSQDDKKAFRIIIWLSLFFHAHSVVFIVQATLQVAS